MPSSQAIDKPFGITVFGSAIIRVPADIAVLRFAVSRLAQTPPEAYKLVRDDAQNVREFLHKLPLEDINSSRISLEQSFDQIIGLRREDRFLGYTATVTFYVILRDLDLMEEILSGVIDAGVNQISSVDLQTSRLKEIRANVRRNAVQAAREKAENYCLAAGVTLGAIIHIEDTNPDVLTTIPSGHAGRETPPEGQETSHAIDPESITVRAAVLIAYEIAH